MTRPRRLVLGQQAKYSARACDNAVTLQPGIIAPFWDPLPGRIEPGYCGATRRLLTETGTF
jgi:hypothetical protein